MNSLFLSHSIILPLTPVALLWQIKHSLHKSTHFRNVDNWHSFIKIREKCRESAPTHQHDSMLWLTEGVFGNTYLQCSAALNATRRRGSKRRDGVIRVDWRIKRMAKIEGWRADWMIEHLFFGVEPWQQHKQSGKRSTFLRGGSMIVYRWLGKLLTKNMCLDTKSGRRLMELLQTTYQWQVPINDLQSIKWTWWQMSLR